MLPAQPNQSLIDGLSCLQALVTVSEPQGLSEIGRRLNLETTRVHRLLKTLAHLGLASQNRSRKYLPGPGIHVLAAQSLFASGLIRRALPELEALAQPGLTVALGVRWRDNVTYLYHALPGMPVAEALGRLGLYPATQSSIGMLLLAQSSDAEVRALYAGVSIPGYPMGLCRLLPALKRIRDSGFARIVHGKKPRTTTTAVPLGDPPYAALALSGPIQAKEHERILWKLQEAAGRITLKPFP